MITLEELSKFARKGRNRQTEINKLCRTNGPQESKDAAKRMVKSGELSRQEKMVYDHIELWLFSDKKDFTTKDIASEIPMPYGKAYDICRRRFSGLFNKFKICLTGDRRDRCRVWRLL